jgi:hypothetical protein
VVVKKQLVLFKITLSHFLTAKTQTKEVDFSGNAAVEELVSGDLAGSAIAILATVFLRGRKRQRIGLCLDRGSLKPMPAKNIAITL